MRNPDDAPEGVAKSKSAVVRIRIAGRTGQGSGTAFFIPGPYLVTNAHVLGPGRCAQEGCTVVTRHRYQRDREYEERFYLLRPHAIDDVADLTTTKCAGIRTSSLRRGSSTS